MFIKNKKLVFDPLLAFDRLEKVSDRYEIPDWVEEEDKKSREKKPNPRNKQKKEKKEKAKQ